MPTIYANSPDEGINKLIREYGNVISDSNKEELRMLRSSIGPQLTNPGNTIIVLYIDDDQFNIQIGQGSNRQVFNIPKSDMSLVQKNEEESSGTMTIRLTQTMVQNKTTGTGNFERFLKTASGLSVGGTVGGALYAALVANPATAPLVVTAGIGASVGYTILNWNNKPYEQTTSKQTFTKEIIIKLEDFRALPPEIQIELCRLSVPGGCGGRLALE